MGNKIAVRSFGAHVPTREVTPPRGPEKEVLVFQRCTRAMDGDHFRQRLIFYYLPWPAQLGLYDRIISCGCFQSLSLSGVLCSPFFHSHRHPGNRVLWSFYTYLLCIILEERWKEEKTWNTEIIKLVARVYLWDRIAFLFSPLVGGGSPEKD